MYSRIFLLAFLFSAVLEPALSSSHPDSSCFAIDRHNYLYDFTPIAGASFTYQNADTSVFTLRFCQDIQFLPPAPPTVAWQDAGVMSFGHFQKFVPPIDTTYAFIQKYMYGDLGGCASHGVDSLGRNAQVNVICDNCPIGTQCTDESDPSGSCICSAQFDDDNCLATILLSVKCGQFQGQKVLKGLTIGLTPRTSEVVRDGVVQWGFDDATHPGYAFETEQRRVALYMSAPFAVSNTIQPPAIILSREHARGLEVRLSGPATDKRHPALATTLSPSILNVDFRCLKASTTPYAVNFSVPVDMLPKPLAFTLTKTCVYAQGSECGGTAFWAYFGFLGFLVLVIGSVICAGGFVYNVHVHKKMGFEALPGHSQISKTLDWASGGIERYSRLPPSSDYSPPEPMISSRTHIPPPTTSSSYGTV